MVIRVIRVIMDMVFDILLRGGVYTNFIVCVPLLIGKPIKDVFTSS